MILWTVQWITISLLLILLVHYLYNYLKNSFTVPIIEDSAAKNKKRYDDMLAPIQSERNHTSELSELPANDTTALKDEAHSKTMKDELQAFLNELKTNDES